MIISYCVVLIVGNMITFIIYRVLRRKLRRDIDEVDSLITTPSDFCVMGQCPEFSRDCDYSSKQIEAQIKRYMYEKYEIDDIVYVNVAYDVNKLYDFYTQEVVLMKQLDLIRWYCKEQSWSEADYEMYTATFQKQKEFPRSPKNDKAPLKLKDVLD